MQSPLRKKILQTVTDLYRAAVKDPETCMKLIPSYDIGCKRITPSNHYLQSFNKENVSLETCKIKCFTENGIQTEDGKVHEVDTIIYATGYSLLQSIMSFQAFGRNCLNNDNEAKLNGHVTLKEEWGEEPNAYKGITYPDYPNLFFLLGPGTALGHHSVVFMIECQISYIIDAIKTMVNKNIKSVEVKKEVNDEYQAWSKQCMKNKVFNSTSCISWYQNAAGINWTLWPSFLTHYWWITRKIDISEYKCAW